MIGIFKKIGVDKDDSIGLKWKTYALDKYWWLMALAWA